MPGYRRMGPPEARPLGDEKKGAFMEVRFNETTSATNVGVDFVRARIRKIYQFLDAYHQLRNPLVRQISEQQWTLFLRELPDSASVTRPDPENPQDRFIFKIRRPALTHCPRPPADLRDWLSTGWDQFDAEPAFKPSINVIEFGKTKIVRFADDLSRVAAFKEWKHLRDEWENAERRERGALYLFERIYTLYGQIEREAEKIELIIGDGILNWRVEEGGIHHPILLKRIELIFNPEIPEFTLADTDTAPELYSALFSASAKVDGQSLQNRVEDLERHAYHPLDPDALAYLNGVLGSLGGGEIVTDPEAFESEADIPRILRDPVLFVRLRSVGVGSAIRAILADIEQTEFFPASLVRIVGSDAVAAIVDPGAATEDSDQMPANEDADVLFAKEANLEQLMLAKRLGASGAALVQGPPGTGKTHTIGNLIGHLLAAGKSILVTSHTAKALRVVREHVHKNIQPLCVSVLDSDARGRQELEISVSKISERLSKDNATDLSRIDIDRKKQRDEVIRQLRELRERLRMAVGSEYRDIIVGGKGYEPSQAARKVTEGHGRNDWIPAPVEHGIPLPLSEGELAKLYGTNGLITPEEERELHLSIPRPAQLLSPARFAEIVDGLAVHWPVAKKMREDLWDNVDALLDTKLLNALLDDLDKALELVADGVDAWRLHAANAGIRSDGEINAWRGLIDLVVETRKLSSELDNVILHHGPSVPEDHVSPASLKMVTQIIAHLEKGKTLNKITYLINPKWKELTNAVQVGNEKPTRTEHFDAVGASILISLKRRELVGRWCRQMTPLGGPGAEQLGEQPEKVCAQFVPLIEDSLGWHPVLLKPSIDGLQSLGLQWNKLLREVPPPVDTIGELRRLVHAVRHLLQPVVMGRLSKQLVREFEAELGQLKATLDKYPSDHEGVVRGLAEALRIRDGQAYRKHFAVLAELDAKKQALTERIELLAKLEKAAPAWATAIRSREGRHGGTSLPGNVYEVWLWRQLHDQLVERQKDNPAEIQARIEELSRKLREITVELIEARAWGYQLIKAAKFRQPLIGWLDTQRRLGARTGNKKRIAELVGQARKLMTESQSAVPVWIMPLVRVYENFDPRRTKFDVVIIDEASQCGLDGLIALYLGKQVVIVGDHEQVSPDTFGTEQAPVDNLIKMTLKGIPNSHLYDGKLSVYDLGRQAFGDTIRLVEHFRCVPEIIQFSNQLSYNGDILPLRESGAGGLEPSVVSYRVEGSRRGQVNQEEALAVASLILAMCKHERYRDKTIGVISLLAENQAYAIDKLLRQHLLPAEYERRRIICGNAAQFQGDERDVMFLSVVDGPKDESPLALRQAGANDMYKKRYNVAASRAKDQMWVVHSLDPKVDLKPGDLRRRLIEHALDPAELMRKLDEGAQRTESEFERLVLADLVRRSFKVVPQWKVGKYRLDLVVQGKSARLAIECDGDRYHPIEKIPEDMARQAVLERLGWKFERIRGSEYFLDPNQAMRSIWRRLERLGIEPQPSAETPEEVSNGLVEELSRVAENFRQEIEPAA